MINERDRLKSKRAIKRKRGLERRKKRENETDSKMKTNVHTLPQ